MPGEFLIMTSPSHRLRVIVVAVAVVAIGFMPGCARRATIRGTKVTGTVTVGGKPASGATVRFFDDGGKSVGAAAVNDDGSYTAVDVPAQALKVAVEEGVKSGVYNSAPPPAGTAALPGSSSAPPAKIPKKYQKADSSGLTVTVAGKEQKFDLSLE